MLFEDVYTYLKYSDLFFAFVDENGLKIVNRLKNVIRC